MSDTPKDNQGKVKGTVTHIDLSGTGGPSAQLGLVVTESSGHNNYLGLGANAEDKLFKSMVFLSAFAYANDITVEANYELNTEGAMIVTDLTFPPK